MTELFYKDLDGFETFDGACDSSNYHAVPLDWFIVVTDVQGSTKAIDEGRYKDVNMVGAACIAATVNSCEGVDIPYVFGGDGATFLVPPKYIDTVKEQLVAVKAFANAMHGLSLRLGVIPVSDIDQKKLTLKVGKFVMPTGCSLAMFSGSGALLIDDMLKNDDSYFIPDSEQQNPPNLHGLSCRWQPISTRHGVILTLLIASHKSDADDAHYSEMNAFITDALEPNANPVHNDSLIYKWPGKEAMRQSKMVWKQGNVSWNVFLHMFQIVLFNVMNRYSLKLPGLDVPSYKQDMITNSDYRKFDGMLRMVVDCTEDQAKIIEEYLEDQHQKGEVSYGTHYSKAALMTCFLESLEKEDHVHFIDGNDGGYAMAAKQLKQQLYDKAVLAQKSAQNA